MSEFMAIIGLPIRQILQKKAIMATMAWPLMFKNMANPGVFSKKGCRSVIKTELNDMLSSTGS